MIKNKDSEIYKIVNIERVGAGFSKKGELNKSLNRQATCFWRTLRKGSTKFEDLIEICDLLELEIIIRNNKTHTEYHINGFK